MTETPIPDTLITTYLEMTSPQDQTTPYTPLPGVELVLMGLADVAYYRFLYRAVGYQWRWRDRLIMPEAELESILKAATTHVYILYEQGVPGGYVELEQQDEGHNVEIAYFGLREPFFGRGLGRHLLNFGIMRAWQLKPQRVWVHTCNMDGPHALLNYQQRGFHIYDVKTEPMPARYRT